jgi:anti-sigma-K factor RskA
MNYQRPELLDRLAADYVVGVLRDRARLRFERLCVELAAARAARERWEDRLLPLALAASPVVPSSTCWAGIQRSLDASAGMAGAAPVVRPRRAGYRWWLAAAASVVAVVLVVGRLTLWAPPSWQPVAALAPAHALPLWQVERDATAGQLTARVVGPITLDAAKSYELWVLPRGGGKPVSLGLLPRTGAVQRVLTAAQRQGLQAGENLAVSIEPAGGSPTGQPTGPVIIVAPIQRAS